MRFILSVFALLLPAVAYAADTGLSLAPVVNYLLDYAVIGVCGVAAWGIGRVAGRLQKMFGIRIDDSQRAVVMGAVDRGVNYAADIVRTHIDTGTKMTVDVRSMLIKSGIEYVQARVPDALAHFKLRPVDIGDMITAKLNEKGLVEQLQRATGDTA